jgi:hypothetical protein
LSAKAREKASFPGKDAFSFLVVANSADGKPDLCIAPKLEETIRLFLLTFYFVVPQRHKLIDPSICRSVHVENFFDE